jgi:hypothetical protein
MTRTDLCVNKPHCAAASKCLAIMVTKKNQSRSYLNHLVSYRVTGKIKCDVSRLKPLTFKICFLYIFPLM